MRAFVYRNLHRGCYSVQDTATRRVADHRCSLVLADCTFRVSESGRQRVLRERRKNVHAGVVGTVVEDLDEVFARVYDERDTPQGEWRPVTYNPYRWSTFVDRETHEPILDAPLVMLTLDGVRAFVPRAVS